MLNLYIGYDPKEAVAYHVLCHSILKRATAPISITPLVRDHFRAFFHRERGPHDSTDFSITRFLVPYLSGYQGWSVFMDCDMLCQTDITQVWGDMKPPYNPAVWVCPHDYTPREGLKMQKQAQTTYPRKNWSSFMVFNNSDCRALTPDYVSTASGLDLHRFNWLKDPDTEVGSLPLDWNWLVGEYEANPQARMLHYTRGGPWWAEWQTTDHAQEWLAEYRDMTGHDFRLTQVWQTPALQRRAGPGKPFSHRECK